MGRGFDFIGNTSARGAQGRNASGARAGSSSTAWFSSRSSSASLSSKEGRIYNRAGESNRHFSQASAASQKNWKAQIRQRTEVINQARKGIAGNSLSRGASVSYTGKELARANRFAAHINGSGNLLNHSGISAKNDEVVGYLAAITSIKGEMFAASSGRQNAMNVPIKSAVNQMVDYYLNRKGIYKVYDYTTNVYEKTGSSQRAMEEGLEYAYRLFQEKKEMLQQKQYCLWQNL